jgi:hypothetical protein
VAPVSAQAADRRHEPNSLERPHELSRAPAHELKGKKKKDRDHDRIPDRWERRHGLSPKHKSGKKDQDQDALRNRGEYRYRTHPRNADTDADGIWDGDEVDIGEPPRTPTSAAVSYLSPQGQDSGNGSKESPLRSLEQSLTSADGGELLLLEPGSYTGDEGDGLKDRIARPNEMQVVGLGRTAGQAQISGLELLGTKNVTFRRLRFDRVVVTDDVQHRGPEFASAHVKFLGNEFADYEGTCLTIRSGSHDIVVAFNLFQRCKTGIGGPNTPESTPQTDTRGITIRNNRIRNNTGDGIQFGHWHDVLIQYNDIGPIGPSDTHNDALQFTGASSNVVIRENHLHDSANQLLFVQPAFGPISDVEVVNNLIDGAGSIAIQVQGVSNLRFINNTVWNSDVSGLLVRPYEGINPSGIVVANNLLYDFMGSDLTKVASHNIVRSDRALPPTNLNLPLGNPGFLDVANHDFHLRPGSLAKGTGSAQYAPRTDLDGNPRSSTRPSIGAYE